MRKTFVFAIDMEAKDAEPELVEEISQMISRRMAAFRAELQRDIEHYGRGGGTDQGLNRCEIEISNLDANAVVKALGGNHRG